LHEKILNKDGREAQPLSAGLQPLTLDRDTHTRDDGYLVEAREIK